MNPLPKWLLAAAALGFLGLGPLAFSSQTSAPVDETMAAVRAILDSGRSRVGADDAVQRIVNLGPEAIPAVLDLLSGQGAVASLEERLPGLNRGEEALLTQALQAWPEERLGRALLGRIDEEATLDTRLWSMRLLGAVGGARSLPAMLELVDDVEPVHFRRKFVSGQIERALAEILERDDSAYLTLEIDTVHLSPALQQCVVRALARAGGSRSVELILGMLGRESELDLAVLSELARLAGGAVHPSALSKLHLVRDFVTDSDVKKCELAILALGRLHDAGSFGEMIGILEDDNPILARCALLSLHRLSGVQWTEDVELWRSWFEREQNWLTEEAPLLAEMVRAGDVSAAASACRELSAHPLFRREVTEALRRGLRHQDPVVVRACCAALERMSGIGAAADLINLLSPGQPKLVRTAAHEALVAMTGETFPVRKDLWKAWLER